MTQLDFSAATPYGTAPVTTSLADILERVLDKGIVIAGDIKIDLLDIELLTIRLRLFISSVETARKAGIDWWETDPALSSRAARLAMDEENRRLRERVAELEQGLDPERALEGDREQDPGQERGRGRGPERDASPARRRPRREVST